MKYKAGTILLTAFLLISCKPAERIVEKEKIIYQTEYRNKIQYDSIHLRDSVFIHARNDTIFYEKWKTEYRIQLRSDTLTTIDSVYKEVPYIVEVPKVVYRQTKWQVLTSFFGAILLILLALWGIYKFIKWKFF